MITEGVNVVVTRCFHNCSGKQSVVGGAETAKAAELSLTVHGRAICQPWIPSENNRYISLYRYSRTDSHGMDQEDYFQSERSDWSLLHQFQKQDYIILRKNWDSSSSSSQFVSILNEKEISCFLSCQDLELATLEFSIRSWLKMKMKEKIDFVVIRFCALPLRILSAKQEVFSSKGDFCIGCVH